MQTAIFCYSATHGNAGYPYASYSASVPISVILVIMAMPIIILPLIVIVYN